MSVRNNDRKRLEQASKVRAWSVSDFHDLLAASDITRAFAVFENGEFTLSHEALRPLRSFLELSQDFARHEGVFIGREPGLPTVFFAFVHDTRRGLAQGGLRFKSYENLAELLTDGLRLAQGMTRKNALAGLCWGGGKGILPITTGVAHAAQRADERNADDEAYRARLFGAYGRFVASLGGIYYTAEDIGTTTDDMRSLLVQNRFTTCIPPSMGGSGNPSPFTAQGVYRAMQAAWRFLEGSDDLRGVRVAIQGSGNVGASLLRKLDDAGAVVSVTDLDLKRLEALKEERPRITIIPAGEPFFSLDVDVIAPCAIGAVINAKTIPLLKARLICGAANNIVKEPSDGEELKRRGITFVPDYLCNRMGIMNCADEWMGYLPDDVRIATERVYPDTLRVLKHARHLGIPTTQAADELADAAATVLHPLFGHRGRQLIDKLMSRQRYGGAAEGELAFDAPRQEPFIQNRWEHKGRFRGQGPTLASMPVSTAGGAQLGAFLSPLLLDVRARALQLLEGRQAIRRLGTDHGGLALQLEVEDSLSYDRAEYGRPEFVARCRDRHRSKDASVRDQLRQLGVGFDSRNWLDPMSEDGGRAVRQLYHRLLDAGLVRREDRLVHHCPRCATTLVASDVVRSHTQLQRRYEVDFFSERWERITTSTFYPELVLGAAALAVSSDGPFASLSGLSVRHPVTSALLPVLSIEGLGTHASFLVPAHDRRDAASLKAAGQSLEAAPVVLTKTGSVVTSGGETVTRELARSRVLEQLGAAARVIEEPSQVQVLRCGRCDSPTIVLPSKELFVDFTEGRKHYRRAIESGAVTFSDPRWRDRALADLESTETWCISRQQWWGHEIPSSSSEVFSTWFTMAAMALKSSGWPQLASPEPIDELFVNPELLYRWVLTTQVTALLITGRPAFKRLVIHSPLQIVERALVERPDSSGELQDEARYLHRNRPRPMRRSFGNSVEPQTLIRRFGADALRLGLMFCLQHSGKHTVTASESNLRRGRRTIHRLNAITTKLLEWCRQKDTGAVSLYDLWLKARSAEISAAARASLARERPGGCALALVDWVSALSRYSRCVQTRVRSGSDIGAMPETLSACFSAAQIFTPLCPFILEGLNEDFIRLGAKVEDCSSTHEWLPPLVNEGSSTAGPLTLEISDPEAFTLLESNHEELEALCAKPVKLVAGAPEPGGQRSFRFTTRPSEAPSGHLEPH